MGASEWPSHEAELFGLVQNWATANGWTVVRSDAPDLVIETPEGTLHLEMKQVTAADRRVVEFMAYPSLFRVRFVFQDPAAGWRILTDSGVYIRKSLDRETFTEIARDLLMAS